MRHGPGRMKNCVREDQTEEKVIKASEKRGMECACKVLSFR